ncbi:hypothetical protein C8R44DRAFT_992928 [Mycena epipterygia]|nr:hypothetical protein C8R44DRAFT_992928 [Mycena epipterygia]
MAWRIAYSWKVRALHLDADTDVKGGKLVFTDDENGLADFETLDFETCARIRVVYVRGDAAYAIAAGDGCVVHRPPYEWTPYVRVSGAQVIRVAYRVSLSRVFVRRGDSHARMVPPRALRDVQCKEGRIYARGESRVLLPLYAGTSHVLVSELRMVRGMDSRGCGADGRCSREYTSSGEDSHRGDDVGMHGEVALSFLVIIRGGLRCAV